MVALLLKLNADMNVPGKCSTIVGQFPYNETVGPADYTPLTWAIIRNNSTGSDNLQKYGANAQLLPGLLFNAIKQNNAVTLANLVHKLKLDTTMTLKKDGTHIYNFP